MVRLLELSPTLILFYSILFYLIYLILFPNPYRALGLSELLDCPFPIRIREISIPTDLSPTLYLSSCPHYMSTAFPLADMALQDPFE